MTVHDSLGMLIRAEHFALYLQQMYAYSMATFCAAVNLRAALRHAVGLRSCQAWQKLTPHLYAPMLCTVCRLHHGL